jgi:multidrug efflux pump subunit AcrB
VARLLTPVMAARWLRPGGGGGHDDRETGTMRRYMRAVDWCMSHRKSTLAAAMVFFILSLALVPLLSTGLLPSSDNGSIDVSVELPPGASLQDTLITTEAARATLGEVQGISHVMAVAGQGSKDTTSDLRHATMTVVLGKRAERPPKKDIEGTLRKAFLRVPGARFSFASGNDDERLELILASDDDTALTASAKALEREIRGLPGLSNVVTSANLERPEIIIRPDSQRAADLGVTAEAIGSTVRVATRADFDARLSKLNLDDRQIPIAVQMPARFRTDLQSLGNLPVPARNGTVPLSSVASLAVESGPNEIDRFDRRRYVTVTAALGTTPLGAAVQAARALPAAVQLPPGVTLSDSGNAENMNDLISGFGLAMTASVLGIYCVLVLLFHDFIQPLTILSALPLSLGGAFVALLVTHAQLNIPSLIGMVMLMGVVTKNSILLVEYALVGMRERGLDARAAMLDACHKRARPIVMTTVAMVSGLLPIVLGFGADASFRQPMAIAVIGGLLTSTGLSLLVVPVVFSLFSRERPTNRTLHRLELEMPRPSISEP